LKDLFNISSELLNSNQPIVIYGAGNTGLDCMAELMNRNVRIDFFCDSNESKTGIYILNKRVLSLGELRKMKDCNIIIASMFYHEIEEQLLKEGFYNLYCYRSTWRIEI